MDSESSRVVVITGGGTGIGYATAAAFAARGWTTVIAGRRPDVLDAAADSLREASEATITAIPTDVADPDSVRALVSGVLAHHGRIDVLVSNAGVLDVRPFEDMTRDAWTSMFDIVVHGAASAAMEVVPHMRERGSGRIVLVGSVSGTITDAGLPHYSAAKAALHSLARGLTVDLGQYGIVANAVAPGWVRTPMNDTFVDEVDPSFMRGLNPLSRAAEPAEIAEVIRYLGIDAPEFLAGATIAVDGGQAAMNHFYA